MVLRKMAEDKRPHLWIPDGEVELVSHIPRGRAKPRDVDHVSHGEKLSKGLQSIVDTYNARMASDDILSEEDIRVFQITLPDGIKLSDQKKFLSEEGLTLNYYQDEKRAIVSTSKERFDRLANRVGAYRDKNRKKDFKYIESFQFPDATSKQTYSLRQYIEKFGESIIAKDIEMLLLPKLDDVFLDKAEKSLVEQIASIDGVTSCIQFRLSDDTRVVRASVPVSAIDTISENPVVCQVIQTSFFSSLKTSTLLNHKELLSLASEVDIAKLPIVAILDTGVRFPTELESVVVEHWIPQGSIAGDCKHGTQVAGKVAFANVSNQMAGSILTPRARIIDCNIFNTDPGATLADNDLIELIRQAAERYHDITRIFNISLNSEEPIDGGSISLLGFELDVLAHKYGIRFVISSGNHHLSDSCSDLEKILDDSNARIAAPADSVVNITVGAIAGSGDQQCISSVFEVAPYSRIGPGLAGIRKPDLVALGANLKKDGGSIHIDEYSLMLGVDGSYAQDIGTSFTAPIVSGDLAEILSTLPWDNVLLAQALLYHGAERVWDYSKSEEDEDDERYLGDWFGRGLSNAEQSSFSNRKRVTFVHIGELNRLTKQRVKFFMPTILERKRGTRKVIRVTVTCLTQSPIDRSKGKNYIGAYVSASLHNITGTGKSKTSNPSGADGRRKWGTCYHFCQEYAAFSAGDWEIWLELFTRDDMVKEEDVSYALAVTIEDMDEGSIIDIYEEIRGEAQERFPVLTSVRIPVR